MPSKPFPEPKGHEKHPVFSDFTHIPNMSTMSFAVQLREEPGSDILGKILPLTKIIPKDLPPPRSPKAKKSPPKKKIISATCEREDCGLRKEQLVDLLAENDLLRAQQKAVQINLEAARNKRSLIEKSIEISKGKNEALKVDLESVQARIESIEVELEQSDNGSDKIKDKMEQIQKDIDALKIKIEKDSLDIERLNESKTAGTMRFAVGAKTKHACELAEETRKLGADVNDDSDDDL